jgi:hypothetical protein
MKSKKFSEKIEDESESFERITQFGRNLRVTIDVHVRGDFLGKKMKNL